MSLIAGLVIGGAAAYSNWSTNTSNAKNAKKVADANAASAWSTAASNAAATNAIAMVNMMSTMMAATTKITANTKIAEYNSALIDASINHMISLSGAQSMEVWQQAKLALELKDREAARQAGATIAKQAAMGTVVDMGSNRDVRESQIVEDKLQTNILITDRDNKLREIRNAMATSIWEGQVAIQKTMFEAQMGNAVTMSNAQVAAASGLATANLRSQAIMQSAANQYYADSLSAQYSYSANRANANNRMFTSLASNIGSSLAAA